MQWRKLARFKTASGGTSRARNMLCCGRRKENGRSVPDLTASPGRAPPPARLKDQTPMVIQSDFRKVSGISSEIFRQIETVENDHDATTAAALEAVERRGEMIVRILEPRQVGRAASEAAKRFFTLQDAKHTVQLVEIVKRPGQTLGLYIREGNGMDRSDGVFISRIALESAVYNSGCLKVGDEILAVNLVDVTHMSLDDVVIIMSIPRRLVLAIRQRKGNKGSGSPSLPPRSEHKPPPVVVIKRELRDEDMMDEMDHGHSNRDTGSLRQRHTGDGREMTESRSRLGLGLTSYSPDQSSGLDLYYNSRPPSETPSNHWSYQPPPPVITEQPKSSVQHFQGYDRGYPKTLESLAEKVHSFYGGPVLPPQGSRRLSTGGQPMSSSRFSNQRIMPRSGSDQHLPRVEYTDYTSISPAGRHTLLRSSLKSGSTLSRYNQRYATTGPETRGISNKYIPSSALSAQNTLTRRNRSLDYSSDTEATCGGSRSSYYYYNRGNQPQSTINTLSRTNTMTGGDLVNKFNSLPRDTRASTRLTMGKRFGTLDRGALTSLLLDDTDGNLSAPEMPHLSGRGPRGHIRSASSVFTSDEYRSWLSRTPSTSAIYEQIRASRDVLNQHRAARFTYSAENIHDALKNAENSTFSSSYGLYGSGRSALTGTLDRNFTGRTSGHPSIPARSLSTQHITSSGMMGSPSARRMRQLLELGSRGGVMGVSGPSPVPTPSSTLPRNRHVDINASDFVKYKFDKPTMIMSSSVSGLPGLAVGGGAPTTGGVSGMLWLHLLAGRGLRATGSGPVTPTGPGVPPPPPPHASAQPARDLYCVLECDRVHKARTVVRTGDLQFDWDESFELDLVNNRQLDLLVYSWDPQHRHKLCYRGAINLVQVLNQSPLHQLALKIEPRGTLFLRLRYTDSVTLYRRRGLPAAIPRSGGINLPLFGADLETVVARESSRSTSQPNQPPIPVIIRRCVEEIERRGLDIIGLYRLCGSATKKRILREAFERNSRSVELTPDNVPDINVITGVLKDYLRELPQPLFTKCLYQMTVDALGVCLPDDPEGNAKLMFSILDCLPRTNRATLIFLLDHLAMVVSVSDRNKMSPQNLATALAPPLMLHASADSLAMNNELDYIQPIGVLKYLLQIWPAPKHSVRRGEPAPGLHGNRASASPVGHSTVPGQYQPSANQYRQAAAASAALQAPSVRPSLAPSQVGHAPSSAKGGQFRPQSPRTGPLPVPPRSRQVIVSSPGSPSSSSDSQSGNETLKHGSSISSIARQPTRGSPGPSSVRPTYQTVPPSSTGRNSPSLNQGSTGRNSPGFHQNSPAGRHSPVVHQSIAGHRSPAIHQNSSGRNSPDLHQSSTGRHSPARTTSGLASGMYGSGTGRTTPSYHQTSSQSTNSYYAGGQSQYASNGQSKSPRESPNLTRITSPSHSVVRTASPGIPGTNAGIAVTMNASPFSTDLSSTSLTNIENTLISNLQSTINNISTTTDTIFNHTNLSANNIKTNDQFNSKGTIYGQKMPAVSSMAVSSSVPCYATYGSHGSQSGSDLFGTSMGTSKNTYGSQSSDTYSTNLQSSSKISGMMPNYHLLNYSSTNPFLQNYSTDPIEEETANGEMSFSSNLFDTLVSGGNDLLNDKRDGRGTEELTPTSSAGTEDSRTREPQERDLDGDAEQSD